MAGRGIGAFSVAPLVLAGCLTAPPASDDDGSSSGGQDSEVSTASMTGPSTTTMTTTGTGEGTGDGLDCDPGFGDCDGRPENGCEVNLLEDLDHCGGCGESCNDVVNGATSCIDGTCTLSCDDGWGDCDESPQTGCEQSLDATDHCGTCGLSCGSSPCENRSCGPETVATGVGCPQGLAIEGDSLYICNFCGNAVMRVDKNGGSTPVTIATTNGCSGVATDGQYLFVGEYNSDELTRYSLDGDERTVLWTGQGVHGVWLDGGSIYWSEHDAGLIRRAPTGSDVIMNPETLMASIDRATSVAADGDTVVYTDYGIGTVNILVDLVAFETFSGFPNAFYVDLDDEYVYWTVADLGDTGERKLLRRPRELGSDAETETLLTLEQSPSGILLHDGYIYFGVGDPGEILRIPIPQ